MLQVLVLTLACILLATAAATAATDEASGAGDDAAAAQQSGRSRVSDEQLNIALSDKRYLNRQLKCALGEAPCDPVGRRLKSTFYTRVNRARTVDAAIIPDRTRFKMRSLIPLRSFASLSESKFLSILAWRTSWRKEGEDSFYRERPPVFRHGDIAPR